MHLPRTHRIDAAAVCEQFTRGIIDLCYERTQNQAADIGTKRFMDPSSWVKVLYLVNIVTPKYWDSKSYLDYLSSMFSDGLPLKPGGIIKPHIGPKAAVRPGAVVPSKKMNKKKRAGKGKPPVQVAGSIQNPLKYESPSAPAPAGVVADPNPGQTEIVEPTTTATHGSSESSDQIIDSSSASMSAAVGKEETERLVMEYCCSPESKLGNPSNFADNNCKVIRYTEEDDMRTDAGKCKALSDIKAFKGKHISLWSSIPCTGGSPWQYVNEAIFYRKGDVRSLRRLRGLRTDFRLFWWNFREIAEAVLAKGGTVCIEWPSSCQYWRDTQVREFLREHGFHKAVTHGCAFGLKTKYYKPGSFMNKALDDCIQFRYRCEWHGTQV